MEKNCILNHSPSLFDALGTEACASEKQVEQSRYYQRFCANGNAVLQCWAWRVLCFTCPNQFHLSFLITKLRASKSLSSVLFFISLNNIHTFIRSHSSFQFCLMLQCFRLLQRCRQIAEAARAANERNMGSVQVASVFVFIPVGKLKFYSQDNCSC